MEIIKKPKEYEKYNYSFSLNLTNDTVENSIVCQRDFNIFNFNSNSLKSFELKWSLDAMCEFIEKDLRDKTLIYSYYIVSPFATREMLEQEQSRGYYKQQLWTDIDNEYKLDTERTTTDYLTFIYSVSGKPVYTRIIDLNVYPKYIRNNIDITNKPRFKNTDSDDLRFEQNLQKSISAGRTDLAQEIISELRYVCAQEDNFYTAYDTKLKV